LFALVQGAKLCLLRADIRKLAVWPWLIGLFTYFSSLYGVYAIHGRVMSWAAHSPSGIFEHLKYGFVWLGVTGLLLFSAVALSFCLVLIFTSAFQTSIAKASLTAHNVELPPSELGLLEEASRTILVESRKLILLLPSMILVFVAGFIPLLAPFAIILGAWLLAFQFVDIVLDIFRLSARDRLAFARGNFISLVCFGLVLGILWAIPFVGIFLAPAATAGAAWFLSEPEFLKEIRTLEAGSSCRS